MRLFKNAGGLLLFPILLAGLLTFKGNLQAQTTQTGIAGYDEFHAAEGVALLAVFDPGWFLHVCGAWGALVAVPGAAEERSWEVPDFVAEEVLELSCGEGQGCVEHEQSLENLEVVLDPGRWPLGDQKVFVLPAGCVLVPNG